MIQRVLGPKQSSGSNELCGKDPEPKPCVEDGKFSEKSELYSENDYDGENSSEETYSKGPLQTSSDLCQGGRFLTPSQRVNEINSIEPVRSIATPLSPGVLPEA